MPKTETYQFNSLEIAPNKSAMALLDEMVEYIHPSIKMTYGFEKRTSSPNEIECRITEGKYDVKVKIGFAWNGHGAGLQGYKVFRVSGYDVESVIRLAYLEFSVWSANNEEGKFYPDEVHTATVSIELDKMDSMTSRWVYDS